MSSSVQQLFDASFGERTVPGVWHEQYWFARHEVVYRHLAKEVQGQRVLEAGCGEGYGADLLAARAAAVVGLDYDAAAVDHARRTYPEVAMVRGNLAALPFDDGEFDVVVSLQTIEHLWDQPGFLAECARVLAPEGWCVLSTPNRHTFPPGNVFHTRELDAEELRGLLEHVFASTQSAGVVHGERIWEWEAEHGSLVEAQLAGPPPSWPAELAEMVTSITAADFQIRPTGRTNPGLAEADALEGSLDLVFWARR